MAVTQAITKEIDNGFGNVPKEYWNTNVTLVMFHCQRLGHSCYRTANTVIC